MPSASAASRPPSTTNGQRLRQQAKNEKNIDFATGWRCQATSSGANQVSIRIGAYSTADAMIASQGTLAATDVGSSWPSTNFQLRSSSLAKNDATIIRTMTSAACTQPSRNSASLCTLLRK